MNYKLKARKGGCLVTFVVIVLIIVAIVVGGVTYVLNKTPDEIGLGGVSLGNDTVDGVGLGNVKISELLNLAKSLTKNAYTLDGNNLPTSEDKAAADKTAEAWNLGKKGDDVYYGKLFCSTRTRLRQCAVAPCKKQLHPAGNATCVHVQRRAQSVLRRQ